jgi:NADPH2:quinone reductase
MPKAICADKPGGIEVLDWREVETPKLGPNDVLIHQTKIGLNFIDVYMTSGTYPFPENGPQIPGGEAAGIVAELGNNVENLKIGDRVAYTTPNGAFREERVLPAEKLVKLPDNISDEVAAASMLKGMTVEYLLNRSFKVQKSHTVLFHAAAGGVGLIAGQWLKHIGAESIGTVGSDDKIDLAKDVGYTHVINYNKSNFVDEVRRITDGVGVDVAYDSVGQATYPNTLSCLKKFGLFVSFGQSSGIIKDIAMGDLQKNGSLYAQRPTLFDFVSDSESLREVSNNMFKMLADGHINMHINQRYPLRDVPTAFEALIARKTIGTTIFDVGRS